MQVQGHSLTDLLFDYAAPDTPKSGAKQQSESLNFDVLTVGFAEQWPPNGNTYPTKPPYGHNNYT